MNEYKQLESEIEGQRWKNKQRDREKKEIKRQREWTAYWERKNKSKISIEDSNKIDISLTNFRFDRFEKSFQFNCW